MIMDNTLSINALMQAIYALQLTIASYRTTLDTDKVSGLSDDQVDQMGERLIAMMQASGEIGMAYNDQRRLSPELDLPDYEVLCARAAWPAAGSYPN